MDHLGERIYKYRTARGLSQLELSELLDVSRQSISKWETDVAVPELSKLVKMAEIFEISLDELVLGKVPENNEKDVTGVSEPAPVPVKKEKPYSRIKAGMGFMFLGVGILLSILILFSFGDIVSAAVIFIPFGLSALFCFKQLKNAALWCSVSFFFVIEWYIYVATGARWDLVYMTLLYSEHVNIWMPIVSWISFAILAFFICMTVFVYRDKEFGYSKPKQCLIAAVTLLALPLKHLAVSLYNNFFLIQILSNGDRNYYYRVIYHNYRLLIPTVDYLIELAFIILFTACLVPTFYWVIGWFRRRKERSC